EHVVDRGPRRINLTTIPLAGHGHLCTPSSSETILYTAHLTGSTTSVCTGTLLLAAAGLLDGLTATTHWGATDTLKELGAIPVRQRVVEHLPERIVTAAGVSSGIDMAIRLVALLEDDVAARATQVFIEYDPEPPFDAGHPSKVGDDVMARVQQFREARR
ncbi:DJ-1/PfpI family protein, partial [Actinomycetospora rhizophila]